MGSLSQHDGPEAEKVTARGKKHVLVVHQIRINLSEKPGCRNITWHPANMAKTYITAARINV